MPPRFQGNLIPPELDEDDELDDVPLSRMTPEELREVERQQCREVLAVDPTNALWRYRAMAHLGLADELGLSPG